MAIVNSDEINESKALDSESNTESTIQDLPAQDIPLNTDNTESSK